MKFVEVAMSQENPWYEQAITRISELYSRQNDIRTSFYRDYTRILHSGAYSRLKHKTQVFFATENDHICTRMEHVNHVASVSYTIAKELGLNTELTLAIATGHDIGHAPFGHQGETVINALVEKHISGNFWHERNSLRVADYIELLQDERGINYNLSLTYAVRDGIICHCGELDENAIKPRKEPLSLDDIKQKGQVQAFTWEGCVVKVADKIAYLGRDIEDAMRINIITTRDLYDLIKIMKRTIGNVKSPNTTSLMNMFIQDMCMNSTPDVGLLMDPSHIEFMKRTKEFCYERIYNNHRLMCFKKYADLIINSIFEELLNMFKEEKTIDNINKYSSTYPQLSSTFLTWLGKRSVIPVIGYENSYAAPNKKLYNFLDEKSYTEAVLDYISALTDKFAISIFHELTSFTNG